ncbi:MAG: hypothetical protein E7603_02365 [Ruminococcaceae bacterium]|nr:hypothetical protein [Oscillospiraceae bacterium]
MINLIKEDQLSKTQCKLLEELTLWLKDHGAGHLSVIVPVGHGTKIVSYIFAEKQKSRKIIFLSSWRNRIFQFEEQFRLRSLPCECDTVNTIINEKRETLKNAELLILHNVNFSDRRKLDKYIGENTRIISFIRAGQELFSDADKDFNTLAALFSSPYLLYRTGKLIDIRDSLFASEAEKMVIDFQLMKYKCTFLEAANNQLRESDTQKAKEILRLNNIVALQNDILNCVGIPKSELLNCMAAIDERKKQLLSSYGDETENCEILSQNEITKILQNIREKYANRLAVSTCENILKESIDESTWNKLDESTKSYLITARYTFESMLKTDTSLSMDYSGVCLLITKTVELEASKRFFIGYQQYLQKRFRDDYGKWPKVMLYTDRHRGITKPTEIFTLGSFVNIAKIDRYNISPIFLDYAKNILFTGMPTEKVKQEIERNCNFIERLRVDFRNPAAHTGSFNRIKATQCFEYVIEIQKMLQKMLQNMKF